MKTLFEQIVDEFLVEQNQSEQENVIYTPEQQKFLARFGELGATHLGILNYFNCTIWRQKSRY
jgi:hypothetical protein